MPAIQAAAKELFGKEPNTTINPDEVVALGAALQAGILQGDVKDVMLLDVVPLSLGIETMGNVATKLIERNTTIPVGKTQIFSTAADNQTSVEVHVVQGERLMAADNKTLGRFMLEGIPPSPRGMPQVEVAFDIDANGILSVKARDKTSGKEQSIRIESTSTLKDEEIERMKQEAEEYAEEDNKKKEVVDLRNAAEALSYTAEKALKDNGDKIPTDLKASVEEKITDLRKVLSDENPDSMRTKEATDALSVEIQKIGESIMKENKQNDGNAVNSDTQEKDDNVRDADFKEEDGKDAGNKD